MRQPPGRCVRYLDSTFRGFIQLRSKFGPANVERGEDSLQGVEGGAAFGPLYAAKISTVELGKIGETFLRQLPRLPK